MDHRRRTTEDRPPSTPTRGYATEESAPTPALFRGERERSGRDGRRLAPLGMLLGLIAAALACGRPQATNTPPPTAARVAARAPFTIALEYAMLGLGEAYAPTGVSFAKPMPVYSVWGNLEPEPGRWVWGPLDALVSEYQSAGFDGLQVLLTAESPWAASRQPKLGDLGNTFPQERYLDDYAAYVTAVVERYDGDGQADMPDLRGGVHQWGVEREFTGYWPGTTEQYVRLLQIAYPAIHAADAQAQVLLVALLLADGFDGSPTRAESERRLAKDASFRKSLDDTLTILAACEFYDMVDFHALGHYTEIVPTAGWIRDKLAANGCGETPIWIGDAFPMSAIVAFGGLVPPMPVAPVTLTTRDQVVALLKAVADPADPDHAASKAWLEAEVAVGLVKKIVAAAGAGVAGINVGNLEDWKTGLPGADKLAVPSLGASMFMGLMDTTVTQEKPGGAFPFTGHLQAQARRAGDARPGFAAIGLAQARLNGFVSVQALDLGPGVSAYRFERPAGPVWVLWYDDGGLYLPGEVPPSTTVSLPFGAERARVTWVPVSREQMEPKAESLAAGATLTLTLDSTPVFVEEAP